MKIYIAGHNGMAGSAIKKEFEANNFTDIVVRTKSELDLLNQQDVLNFFNDQKPDIVILAAAKVGGIQANISSPFNFLFENLQIQNNIFNAARLFHVKKIIFLSSSCIYPTNCAQPMEEDKILSGKLEPTNEGYALAKIAGMKMLEALKAQFDFSSTTLIPCNLYGPNDSFDLNHSHVLSALVKKFVDAEIGGSYSVTLWGTGIARREFMHVSDLARAVLYLHNFQVKESYLNIGSGIDISINDLAYLIAGLVGFKGRIFWDDSKPDGMLRKCMNVSKISSYGFKPIIGLEQGIVEMIEIYKNLKN
jgi:GDP-L-fucose synthase